MAHIKQGMEKFEFVNGTAWVHGKGDCAGEFCCIHNPSMHAMVEEPMILRETTLVERQCKHGVGHTDPDSAAYLNEYGPVGSRGTWGIHGCDGCCAKLEP